MRTIKSSELITLLSNCISARRAIHTYELDDNIVGIDIKNITVVSVAMSLKQEDIERIYPEHVYNKGMSYILQSLINKRGKLYVYDVPDGSQVIYVSRGFFQDLITYTAALIYYAKRYGNQNILEQVQELIVHLQENADTNDGRLSRVYNYDFGMPDELYEELLERRRLASIEKYLNDDAASLYATSGPRREHINHLKNKIAELEDNLMSAQKKLQDVMLKQYTADLKLNGISEELKEILLTNKSIKDVKIVGRNDTVLNIESRLIPSNDLEDFLSSVDNPRHLLYGNSELIAIFNMLHQGIIEVRTCAHFKIDHHSNNISSTIYFVNNSIPDVLRYVDDENVLINIHIHIYACFSEAKSQMTKSLNDYDLEQLFAQMAYAAGSFNPYDTPVMKKIVHLMDNTTGKIYKHNNQYYNKEEIYEIYLAQQSTI